MVPDMRAKFGVREKSGSGIMGKKRVKRGHLGSLSDFSQKVLAGFCRFYACE